MKSQESQVHCLHITSIQLNNWLVIQHKILIKRMIISIQHKVIPQIRLRFYQHLIAQSMNGINYLTRKRKVIKNA
jgi:hypothetical protein